MNEHDFSDDYEYSESPIPESSIPESSIPESSIPESRESSPYEARHYAPRVDVEKQVQNPYGYSHSEQELGTPLPSAANLSHVPPMQAEPEPKARRGCLRAFLSLLEWLFIIVLAVGASFAIRAFVAEVYIIPTGSMLETIQLGDRVVGEKLSYHFRKPEVGEVVTFNDPDGSGATLIKRVVAVEGQTIDLQDGVVVIDGQALTEPYTLGKRTDPLYEYAPTLEHEIVYPYTVPQDCVWVMGDNRNNSKDSRYFGAVSLEEVSSHALFVWWPFENFRTL